MGLEKKASIVKKFGLIGKRLDYSFSPSYFAYKFKKLNLEAQYRALECTDIQSVQKKLKADHWSGLNVTNPFKKSVIPLLDSITKECLEIGAVNTIQCIDNKLVGHNTDWIGFSRSLSLKRHTKALILGNGGAHDAIHYALAKSNIHTTVIARNPESHQIPWRELDSLEIESFTLIVNCTPLGTFPHLVECPEFPYSRIHPEQYFYDLVYNPEKTEFLRRAEARGASIQNGHLMLIEQAEEAWKIWNSNS